ncbi:MAG TPA: hypothetical protein VFD64_20715 [Gemmatimonadaceae bacterium]|nr:hypothetical protein [Gemmatimonadaceae bacterium]
MKFEKARWLFVAASLFAAACSDSPSGPRVGSLVLTIAGVPAGSANVLTITGPSGSGFSRTINASETLDNLVPGRYTVVANVVSEPSGIYEPATATQQVDVVASLTPAAITVAYAIVTGSIAIDVTGLPQGSAAAITVTGPSGYYQQVTATGTLSRLTPGSYSVSTSSVSATNGHVYSGTPLGQTINVFAAESPRNVNARYTLSTGALEVTVAGLPGQQGGSVAVSGPGGFSATVTATTTLVGLFPGSYSVLGSPVTAGMTYAPNPPSQNVDVTASLTAARATVTYVEANQPPPAQFNLTIDGMYLTQAVQTYAGSVPLVAGLPGLLRVFVKASAPNTVGTTARLQLYQGSTLAQTITLQPNVPGVPTSITEATMSSTWNASIPGSLIQPGLRILVDVDPGNAVAETDEGDNTFPRDGTPFVPRVEFTAPLNVTVVPVALPSTGLTGNVSLSNLDNYFTFARKVFPIKDFRVTLHETFTSSAKQLFSDNGNNAWLEVLGEINALRVAEGTSDYYMGVVGTDYTSGVAGMAFTPGKSSVVWDKLPSAAPLAAHELSHSLSRLHAPCGGVATPDPQYPHPLGTIGVYGYDVSTGSLKSPGTSDLMGYCGFGWISDYTYLGILNYRLSTNNSAISPNVLSHLAGVATEPFVQSAGVRETLVVWGRVENGRLILEPAFSATTRPVLPSRSGAYRIEGRTSAGRVLFSYAFEGERPADVPDLTARSFAFAIPLDDSATSSLARIVLTSASGARTERSVSASQGAARFDATHEATGAVHFRLDDPDVSLAIVRDRATQRILAFVRPGTQPVRVRTRAEEFDVQFSNGVRSTGRSVRAVRR